MMTRQKILVLRKPLQCEACRTGFNVYTEAADEGFGYAAQLYECNKCRSIFSHSIEDEQYLGSPRKKLIGKLCPECTAPLEETLKKTSIIGACPNCGNRNGKRTGDAVEMLIEAYQIYK